MYGTFLLFLFLMFDNLGSDFKDTESPRLYISLLSSGHNNLCTLLFLCVFYKVGTLIYQLPILSFLSLKLYNLHILIDLLWMLIFYRYKKYIFEIWNILIYNIKYISWIKRNPPLWIVQISFHDFKSNSLYLMD